MMKIKSYTPHPEQVLPEQSSGQKMLVMSGRRWGKTNRSLVQVSSKWCPDLAQALEAFLFNFDEDTVVSENEIKAIFGPASMNEELL